MNKSFNHELDRHLYDLPVEPEIVGICCGCGEEVYESEEYGLYENQDILHDDPFCITAFFKEGDWIKK